MTVLDLLVIAGCIAIGFWIVRSVMQPGIDLIEEGRRAAERLAEGIPKREVRTPPGPRSTPRVVARHAARAPVSRPGAMRGSPRTTSREPSLDAWYLVLDVSPDATRREIHEALKLRLARARAERDPEAARRVLRAGAAAVGQPQRGPSD